MNVMKKTLIISNLFFVLLPLSACVTSNVPPFKDTVEVSVMLDKKLNGEWEGTIFFNGGDSKMRQQQFHLTLEGSRARYFEKNTVSGAWAEAMPGMFRASYHGANAVIQGTHFGDDNDGNWVETWVLVVTRISEESLRVEWIRMVNNVALPSSDPRKVFSYGGSGVFNRINNG